MENSYGIGVTNKYSVFLDDEDGADPFETLEKVTQKEKDERKAKASGKENKSSSSAKSASSKTAKRANVKENVVKDVRAGAAPAGGRGAGAAAGRGGGPRRGGFASGEGRDERATNRRFYDDRPDFREGGGGGPPPRFGGPVRDRSVERRGRGRGRGFGGMDNRGKREFDRQSGSNRSGVKPVDKRDGAGRGNWGTVQDDLADLDPATHEAAPATTAADADDGGEPTAVGADEAGAEPAEEGPRELTLDEWRRQQQPRAQPQFKVRRAGEGENTAQWKGTFELKKKRPEDEESDDDEEEDDEEEEHVRHGRPKNFVQGIQFTFSDGRRGGRGMGRGGRGDGAGFRGGFRGGRGGRGAGGPGGAGGFSGEESGRFGGEEAPGRGGFRGRGGRGAPSPRPQHAPNVTDERDFPSLG